jgi:hypothetical protein
VSQLPQDAARRLAGRLDAPEHVFGGDLATQLAAQCWCDPDTSGIEMDSRLAEAFVRRLRPILADLEDERLRHAACGVVAMANTHESAARQRQMLPKYRSASVQDVEKAVDREMRYRDALNRIGAYAGEVAPAASLAEIARDALHDSRLDRPTRPQ